MASVGITQEDMAAVLEVSAETLVKHYGVELTTAAAAANEAVGRSLWTAVREEIGQRQSRLSHDI